MKPIFVKEITVGNIISLIGGVVTIGLFYTNMQVRFSRLEYKIDSHDIQIGHILINQEDAKQKLSEFTYYIKYRGTNF